MVSLIILAAQRRQIFYVFYHFTFVRLFWDTLYEKAVVWFPLFKPLAQIFLLNRKYLCNWKTDLTAMELIVTAPWAVITQNKKKE